MPWQRISQDRSLQRERRAGKHADEDEPHVTDARVGDQALQIGLAEREHRAVEDTGDAEPNRDGRERRCRVVAVGQNRPIHIVAADNNITQETIIISVYEPTIQRWESDFFRRK